MHRIQQTQPIQSTSSDNLDENDFWGSSSPHLSDQVFIETEPEADLIDQAMLCAQSFNNNALENFRLWQYQQAIHARERNRQGLGGICEDCKNPIPTARLVAKPNATRCIDCQRIFEKRSDHAGNRCR
jgi:phage/conjugal plasmid C-4 type zinc finger TraR family protein